MRITKLIVLLVTLLLLPGTALANPEEQFILNQVNVGNFDVWQHTNGTWQDTDKDGKADPYGQTGKKVTETYTYPQSQYANQFTPTRVEIKHLFTLTNEELTNAGRSESWNYFSDRYLKYQPNNYSATKTNEDLTQGKVTVQKTFDLMPKSLNLKDPTVRAELGMTDRDFSDMAQGWRWYTPVLIKWYGVPKDVVQPPDFSVTLDRHEIEEVNPGDKVELTATFTLNENHEQPETARLAAFHAVGEGEYPLALLPVDPSDALDADGIIEFSPGESKQFKVKATVQGRNSKILAKIWPAGGDDVNWSNNSDEAHIRLNQNLWVELVGSTEIETSEGNSVNLTARIHNDSGVMVVTRVIWKLDGKVIKDVSDFDVISHGDSSITINPGEGSHIITVEVNPDRNRPVDEATFDDNKANGSIYVAPALKEESGDVQIIGPDTWEALKPYPFTVKITGYLPYERYRDRDGRVRYRSKTYNMNVNTHGEGVLTIEWATHNQFGNPQKTKPVVKSWSESYSKSSGSFTKTINYEFPVVGMRGLSKSNLVIEATDSRFGTARKVVTINPAPVKRPGLQLTK